MFSYSYIVNVKNSLGRTNGKDCKTVLYRTSQLNWLADNKLASRVFYKRSYQPVYGRLIEARFYANFIRNVTGKFPVIRCQELARHSGRGSKRVDVHFDLIQVRAGDISKLDAKTGRALSAP